MAYRTAHRQGTSHAILDQDVSPPIDEIEKNDGSTDSQSDPWRSGEIFSTAAWLPTGKEAKRSFPHFFLRSSVKSQLNSMHDPKKNYPSRRQHQKPDGIRNYSIYRDRYQFGKQSAYSLVPLRRLRRRSRCWAPLMDGHDLSLAARADVYSSLVLFLRSGRHLSFPEMPSHADMLRAA